MGWSPPKAPGPAVVIELQPLEESLFLWPFIRCMVEHCGAQALSTRSYKEPSNAPATFLGLGQSLGIVFTMPGSPITFVAGFLRPQETSNRKAAAFERSNSWHRGCTAQGVHRECTGGAGFLPSNG